MRHTEHLQEFLACVGDLLASREVQSMRNWRHHFDVTCYEHSLFVAYVTFRLASRLRLDCHTATRAALLHDLYLYDPANRSAHPGNQCLDHPVFALRNAQALCGDLTPVEENAILAHMWPLARSMPRSKEAVLLSLTDKLCATVEVLRIYRIIARRNMIPVAVPQG